MGKLPLQGRTHAARTACRPTPWIGADLMWLLEFGTRLARFKELRMETLYEYFRGDYLSERKELEAVDGLLKEIWPTFANCFRDGRWPYEVTDNERIELPEKCSASTSSMILFAMGAALGRIDPGSFQVAATPLVTGTAGGWRKSLEETMKRAFEDVLTSSNQLAQAPVDNNLLTLSDSFGRNDPFTLTWFVGSLLALRVYQRKLFDELRDEPGLHFPEFFSRMCRAIAEVIGRVKKEQYDWRGLKFTGGNKHESICHVFPLLRIKQLASVVESSLNEIQEVSPGDADQVKQALNSFKAVREPLRDHLLHCVHRHLSYKTIRDAPFDAAELVFSLEGAILCEPSMVDQDLLDRTFRVIEQRQKANPYWRPLKPFVTTPQGFALLPLSVEIANSLLRVCEVVHAAHDLDRWFSDHVAMFKRYFDWTRSRVTRGKAAGDIPFVGWHSEHVQRHGKIHPWQTSQVAVFLMLYRNALDRHVAKRCADAASFSIKRISRRDSETNDSKTPLQYWKEKVAPHTPMRGSSVHLVHEEICRGYIEPRDPTGAAARKRYSMLLYGPPGTGKTQIAEDLAAALKWRLIEITPSDFVARGEAEVELRAKYIFEALQAQKDVVVLFDEIDRLLLDRDSKMYSEQGDMFQVMTPGMLTKLKNLRSTARCIFVIATNYMERIDPAAIRAGRVDQRFLVAPPNLAQRSSILRERIEREIADGNADLVDRTDAGVTIADNDVQDIAKCCTYAVFGDLRQLVWRAVGESIVDRKVRKAGLLQKLKDLALQEFRPAIRISNYSGRFKDKEQKPFAEFMLLVYLGCEAGKQFTRQEKELITGTLRDYVMSEGKEVDNGNAKASLAEHLRNCSPDGTHKTLADKVDRWWCQEGLRGG
jgi:hypothetical protein